MIITPLILGLSAWEIIAIVAVFVLLFGASRIPDLMKNVGKGVRSFKEGIKDVEKEINTPVDTPKEETKE